ncbi:AbrB family transcriptional regulator [candidate division WOR-3 bacterium]|uniref:AbrB family transcriptional regulator n=1 Tax=candidate division WOR-3 bacterium TaxID=2052148 RepID=A0A9D5KBL6_UNCW3|nr:AbrB family transcriptional regulator [candidate division WOR-3 bacterium]MBD3365194.1 AbrB family transcriptional regulator [candidate division WOR-3 bacterium]
MNKKGVCTLHQIFFGIVTVSDKGQIAIPVDARNALDIKPGDKLFVLRRKDGKGVTLVKAEVMDELLRNMLE